MSTTSGTPDEFYMLLLILITSSEDPALLQEGPDAAVTLLMARVLMPVKEKVSLQIGGLFVVMDEVKGDLGRFTPMYRSASRMCMSTAIWYVLAEWMTCVHILQGKVVHDEAELCSVFDATSLSRDIIEIVRRKAIANPLAREGRLQDFVIILIYR